MSNGARMRRLAAEWELLVSSLQAPSTSAAAAMPARVGVTLLTGFLGAGKTSLLRHLLHGAHGLKLAAVVNDIGAVNIDAAMIRGGGGAVIELTNGCSCCALGAELGRTLSGLTGQDPAPDAIVIEASGIADPAAMAVIVGGDERARLDGIVAVADAAAMPRWLDNPATAGLFQRQLDAAHLVFLNKADLVDATGLEARKQRLAALAPGRPVIAGVKGRLAVSVALGAGLKGARVEPPQKAHDLDGFETRTIMLPGPIDRDRLLRFLAKPPPGLLRVKGFVEFRDAPGRFWSVQAVGRLWHLDPWRADPRPDSPAAASQRPDPGLVLIALAGSPALQQIPAFG